MNFPSPADGGINSVYGLDEENHHYRTQNNYLLEEQVQHLSLENHQSSVQYDFLQQNYYAAPNNTENTEPYETDLNYAWEQEPQNLDLIITELNPEEIRWFYKSDTDKRWLEFNGYDSFKIEFEYRQYSQEWHSAYNYESHNESASYFNPSETHHQSQNNETSQTSTTVPESEQQPQQPILEQSSLKHKIVVRGGLYEVDLNAWKCYSIFWPGKTLQ